MITAAIFVNGNPIFSRSAVNIGKVNASKLGILCRYKLDDGSTLLHHRDDGAIKLAIAMLKTIHEVGVSTSPKSRKKSG